MKTATGIVTLFVMLLSNTSGQECYCSTDRPLRPVKEGALLMDVYEGYYVTLHCCPDELYLGQPFKYDKTAHSVTWTFNGKPYAKTTDAHVEVACLPYELLIKSATQEDYGEYTCTYDVPGHKPLQRTYRLIVHDFSSPPSIHTNTSSFIPARPGEEVVISCTAFTSAISRGSMDWIYYCGTLACPIECQENRTCSVNCQGKECKKDQTSDLTISTEYSNWGKVSSTLEISSIGQYHYGTYSCRASKHTTVDNKMVSYKNFTVKHGVVEHVAEKEILRAVSISIIVAAVVFITVLLCTYYNRLTIVLSLRQLTAESKRKPATHDVFILHGDNASPWVWNCLVPTLETKHGYSCYVPNRDLLGGESTVEVLGNEIQASRRVLVVVTPCLVECSWTLLCLDHAFLGVIEKRLKIIAVVKQEIKEPVQSKETGRLLYLLSLMKTIRYPVLESNSDKGIGSIKDSEIPAVHKYCPAENVNSNTLFVPLSNISRTKSELGFQNCDPSNNYKTNSLGNLKVLNMISSTQDLWKSSNKTTDQQRNKLERETRPRENDNKEISEIYDEPDSPCSGTPFFASSIKTCGSKGKTQRLKESEVNRPLSKMFKRIFARNKEHHFWQQLLRELPALPANKNSNVAENNCNGV